MAIELFITRLQMRLFLGLKEMEKKKTFMYISKYLGKEKYVFVPIMNYLCV